MPHAGQRPLFRFGRYRDVSGRAIVRVRRSWTDSHQIDDREQPDPDDVERVPEQGKAQQAALHAGAKPLIATCAIITASQISPAVTCSPWQPTSVKNADRKALRCGVAPRAIMSANSRISRARNAAPSTNVTQRKEIGVDAAPRIDRQRHQPARVARGEQTSGFDRDADLIEQLRAGRTARSRIARALRRRQRAPRTSRCR